MMAHTARRLAVPTTTEIELATDDQITAKADDLRLTGGSSRALASYVREELANEVKAIRIIRQIERLHSLLPQAPVAIRPIHPDDDAAIADD